MGLKWTLLLFAGVLLSCCSCLDWQGAGNMTYDNLTIIRNKINAFDPKAEYTAYTAFATTLSKELNDLWAPAWNVVVIYYDDGNNYDTVLYGYGFNGHWFWFNGFQVNSGYVSFIIWKDFNCVRWVTHNPDASDFIYSTFAATIAIYNTIAGGYAGRDVSDIWVAAQDIQAKVPTADASLLQDKLAYTVIATQALNCGFYGQFCAKDYYAFGGVGTKAGARSGSALILQMRAS